MNNLLTKEETNALKSMSRYWDEVSRREDTSPLGHEMQQVYQMLGVRILFIISEYVNKGIPADIDPDVEAMRADLIPIESEVNCEHSTD